MAEYIDREEVINLLWLFADESCCSIVSDIENLPAADVTPVRHARWIPLPYKSKYKNMYGNCREGSDLQTDLCPYCGAIMDGGGDNAAD